MYNAVIPHIAIIPVLSITLLFKSTIYGLEGDKNWKYFSLKFDCLQLKKLIATHYETDKTSYKLEMYRDEAGVHTEIKTLEQNGDFRSPECIEPLQESDIVVTNPPFSLFREYIAQLMKFDKKFLIIGNMNAITYKEIFPLLKDNRIWP